VTSGASGAPCWDDFTLIQHGGQSASVIGSIWPDGSQFFNIASTNFTFSVTSASTGGYPLATNQTSGIQVLVSIGVVHPLTYREAYNLVELPPI